VKYSVETMDPDIFDRICRGHKGHTLEFILDSLQEAVEVFGRNHVSSNILTSPEEGREGSVYRIICTKTQPSH